MDQSYNLILFIKYVKHTLFFLVSKQNLYYYMIQKWYTIRPVTARDEMSEIS